MLMTDADGQTRQLVTSQQLLTTAYRSQSALAVSNLYNAETLVAHVRAANELHVSIIFKPLSRPSAASIFL